MSTTPEKNEIQKDCQQKLTAGGEGREKQKGVSVGSHEGKARNEPKRIVKCVSGVRKVWGTRKKQSCDEVAKEIIRVVVRMASRFSIGKQVGQSNGKNGWWFVVKVQEKNPLDWMRSGNTSTGSGTGFEEERMIL